MTGPMIPTVNPNVSTQVVAQQAQPQTNDLAKFLLALRAQQNNEAQTQIQKMTLDAQIAEARQRQSALDEAKRLAAAQQAAQQQAAMNFTNTLAQGGPQGLVARGTVAPQMTTEATAPGLVAPIALPNRDTLQAAIAGAGPQVGGVLENKGVQDLVKAVTDARAAAAAARGKNTVVGKSLINEATGKPLYTEGPEPITNDAHRNALLMMDLPQGTMVLSSKQKPVYDKLVQEYRRTTQPVTNITMKAESAFEQAKGSLAGEQLKSALNSAINAWQDNRIIQEATDQLKKPGGVITGPFANPQLALERVAKQVGFMDGQDVTNTQVFLNATGRRALALLKSRALGSGQSITDADLKFALKITGGDFTLDKQTIYKILDLAKRANDDIIALYKQKSEKGITDYTEWLKADDLTTAGAGPKGGEGKSTVTSKKGDVSYQGKTYTPQLVAGQWVIDVGDGLYVPVTQGGQ